MIDATGVNALIINTGTSAISNSGIIEATGTGGLVIDSSVTNKSTAIIEANGGNVIIANTVANAGSLLVNGDHLDITGAVSGVGTATISGVNSVLEFGAASTAKTTFTTGALGMLKLDAAQSFSGTVAGLVHGDSIDLANFASDTTITKITGTGTVGTTTNVTLTDAASHLSETLHLENTFADEFGTSASDYVLTHVTPIVGILFELA